MTENNEEALYEGIKKMISDKKVFDYYKKQAKTRGNKFSTSETVKAVEEMLEEVATEGQYCRCVRMLLHMKEIL